MKAVAVVRRKEEDLRCLYQRQLKDFPLPAVQMVVQEEVVRPWLKAI